MSTDLVGGGPGNHVSAVLLKLRAADRPTAIVRAREAGIATRLPTSPGDR